ncbi:hypothetical protein niasHS_008584 [Heterodera schachtii]|uniref:B30.2/SPRY domain-containing protein n=2 Tax=Heterodera TaxID=34509 RepID=A0ABD2J8B3_HETSC
MPSLTTTFSSADEFSSLQPILPNLSTSEEMSVLIARIAELNRANTVEPSIACSADLFGQDGNGSEDDEFSPTDEEDGQKNEERETPTNEAADDERFSQLQNDQKIILEKIIELEKQQKEQTKATAADQFSKILEKISEMEKQQKQQHENTTKATAVQSVQFSKILEKISELEKQHENTTKANSDQLSEMQNDKKILLEKISELEKEQKQLQKENIVGEERFSQLQNDRKKLLEKISEMEKQKKQRKELLNFQQNYWDVNNCHENLEIIGNKNLIVHHKGDLSDVWCSVFAKYPILLNNNSSDFFYFEISVKNKGSWFISFGFALKQQNKLDGAIGYEKGTYAYESDGDIWMNGERKARNDKYSYGVGDTVGIGFNSATRQIIFTKNGLRLDSTGFFVAPFFDDDSFHPFVCLVNSDDKIEANFGPNFKFDLTTL